MAKQFNDVSSRYGAPMGRREDGRLETDIRHYVRLFRVRLDSGGYDDGGAYGGSGQPLFCAIDDDGNRQFTRAAHRTQAALILDIPTLALKNPLPREGRYNAQLYGDAILSGRAPMPQGVTEPDVITWMQRCGARMGQAEDMRPKRLADLTAGA